MSLSVGCHSIATFDPSQHAHIASWLLYPTDQDAATISFGAYKAELAVDARPSCEPAALPLVVISHGNGSTPWVHRGIALHLVRAGFAVLMVEHPGNNRNDNSLGFNGGAGRVKAVLLEHRPRHVRLAVDAALADTLVGPALMRAGYAVIGESIGAYTALALAGGHAMTLPDDIDRAALTKFPAELAKLAFPVPTQADERVRAAVLLAPAIAFFMADAALEDVKVPLLVRTGRQDAMCPNTQVGAALRSLPDRTCLQWLEVEGAGHFSFQTPYPPERAHLPSAQDPPGFDRAEYQETLKQDITTFLRGALARTPDNLEANTPR